MSWLYAIQIGDSGPIKLGRSRSPKDRLKQLQVASPWVVKLLGVCEGNARQERDLHERFSEFRMEGEWFQNSTEIQEFTKTLMDSSFLKCKPPPDFT